MYPSERNAAMNDSTERNRRRRASSATPVTSSMPSSLRGPPGASAARRSTTPTPRMICDGRSGGRDHVPIQKFGSGGSGGNGGGAGGAAIADGGEPRISPRTASCPVEVVAGSRRSAVRHAGPELALGAVEEDGHVPRGDPEGARDVLAGLLLEEAQGH